MNPGDPKPIRGLFYDAFTPEKIAKRKARRELELAEMLAQHDAIALQNWTDYDPTRAQ